MGTMPFSEESFLAGVAEKPDFIIADSGSCDIGPYPLGADIPPSAEAFQRHDLEHMLLAARKLGVPMIVGSASDTGTDRGVDQYVRLIGDIARQHGLAPFRLAAIHTEMPVAALRARLEGGETISGLNGRADLDIATLERTDRVVAVVGAEPIMEALKGGADVIICGRTCDVAIFAAPLILRGHSRADAYFAGKALECASFCAEPYRSKETVLGRIADDGVYLTAMSPLQRCTPTSVAAHAMYERANPFREHVPGGYLDMTNCRYEAVDERTTRVTGQAFVADDAIRVKIEGAGKVAERRIFIAGLRDPHTIAHLDEVLRLARERVAALFGPPEGRYAIHYHRYGRDGVMGELEPNPVMNPQEMCIIADVTAQDPDIAEQVCHIAGKAILQARLPGVKGTAGIAGIFSDEVMHIQPAYEWTLNHLVTVDRADALARVSFSTVSA
jgi:hypothetical protein